MMPVIRISDATWERLKAHARPFDDKPEDIVNMALDALDEKHGRVTSKAVNVTTLSKPTTGRKLPQKEFRMPLIRTLFDMGGSADVSKIRKAMTKTMGPLLSDADRRAVSTGEPRWWNAICWERANLVREGLFAADSERGVWELTEKGKSLVESGE